MKAVIYLILTLAVNCAIAANYECKDIKKGRPAYLSIKPSLVIWNEVFHSASSKALYLGVEDALYSNMKGFHLFRLTDFYTTADSSNILAVAPNIRNSPPSLRVVTYFDNDGHDEEQMFYNCSRKTL